MRNSVQGHGAVGIMGVEGIIASQENRVVGDVAVHVRRPVLKAPQVVQDVVFLVPFCMAGTRARRVVNDSEGGQVEDALTTCFSVVPSVALTARPSYIGALQWSS